MPRAKETKEPAADPHVARVPLGHHLERDRAPQVPVLGPVHHAHAPAAQGFEQPVVPEQQ